MKQLKMITALILSAVLIFSVNILPISSFAEEVDSTVTSDTQPNPEETASEEFTTDTKQDIIENFGDVNEDGSLTAEDARILLRCAVALQVTTDYILSHGDYDRSNSISSDDARSALRVAVGLDNIKCFLEGHELSDRIMPPTCTEQGYTYKKCNFCYYTAEEKFNITPAKGHTFALSTVKPTCTTNGYSLNICTVCKFTDNIQLNITPALGHNYQTNKIEPTCINEGYSFEKCSVCGATTDKHDIVAVKGHNFSVWKTVGDKKSRECLDCKFVETKVAGKTIYLTFDDGPGPYTEKLLGYLKEYNVKATFFVTNQNSKYKYVLKKIVDDGHSIGVHSYTHQWSIYKSQSNYLSDFNKMHKLILDETGVDTKIFRFPGGTSNTVSRKQCTGIMKQLSRLMLDKGYVYYDWNVDSGDTKGYNSSQIAQSTINQIKNKKNSIVLMHDIKKSTVEAIKTVIEYGLKNGYEFAPIDKSTPVIAFKPVN